MEQHNTFKQLQCTDALNQSKLTALQRKRGHKNLILSTKELQQLHEIVSILQSFAEATDMTQGDKVVTIS